MLKRVTPDQAHALREGIEADLEDVTGQQMRGWLADVRKAAVRAARSSSPNVLLAAAGDEMPGMGTVAGWWAQRVDDTLVMAVHSALDRAFSRWTDQRIEASPAETATNTYLASVRDRLVLGTHFGVPVYEDSFERIRLALASSAANGWTRPQLAQRIAAELSWETDGPYWRSQLAAVDRQIDETLDRLGEPGAPAREHARLNDPNIKALRDERNWAIKHLDAERSVWQTRATLIARTEATGGANFGALQALTMEGVATKVWLASGGARTRLTHSVASGQEVGIGRAFMVGGALLQFPGDPAGPVQEVANCRCAMIGGDSPADE
jgi:hypothetical protein